MNAKLLELAQRRATLVARAAAQRATLSQAYAPWRGPLAIVDQGLVALRYIRGHPALLVGVVALMAVLRRPKRVAQWLERGWVAWGAVLAVKRGLSNL